MEASGARIGRRQEQGNFIFCPSLLRTFMICPPLLCSLFFAPLYLGLLPFDL
jgi:hypothetical protein